MIFLVAVYKQIDRFKFPRSTDGVPQTLKVVLLKEAFESRPINSSTEKPNPEHVDIESSTEPPATLETMNSTETEESKKNSQVAESRVPALPNDSATTYFDFSVRKIPDESPVTDNIFDPRFRAKLEESRARRPDQREALEFNSYIDNAGKQVLVDGDKCYKLTNLGNQGDLWSMPYRCSWVQTQSEKMMDTINADIRYRYGSN